MSWHAPFDFEAMNTCHAPLALSMSVTAGIGAEEQDIIEPRQAYDAALCMYHDQALIPIKTIGVEDSFNCTLSLPFTGNSPDHGTALNIAGRGIASPRSLIAALNLAGSMARTASTR